MFINLKDQNKIVHIKYDSDNIILDLEKGIYDVTSEFGYLFFSENKAFQKGKIAKAGIFEQVSNYVDNYFSDNGKKVRQAMNQQTRLGLFFKGEPGTGKTFLAAKLALQLIEKENGVGIYTTRLSSFDMTEVVDAIRTKSPDRLVVFILDEFEKDYNNLSNSSRDNLLAFLDGGRSRNNVMVIATANSLNGIPSTLLQRPGRFEKVLEFHITDDAVLTNLVIALVPEEFSGMFDMELLKNKALSQSVLTIDTLKSIVRDSLTHFLSTGELFPKEELESINKDTLKEESKKKNRRKKKSNPAFNFLLREAANMAEEDDDEYDYDENEAKFLDES